MNLHAVRGYLGPLALLVVGIASLSGAGYYWKQTDTLLKSAVVTTGEVVVMREEDRHVPYNNRGDAQEVYCPVIRFTTAEGRQIWYESIVSSYPPRYSEGDRVRILYDPRRPEWARIDDFPDLWLRPLFLAGVGSILTMLGAASLRTRYKYGWERAKREYYRSER